MVIDNFKEVSHIKGPTFCIKMIQQLGNDLIHLTRADDVVGRSWGGEFILILPETKDEGAQNLKARISHYVSEHLYGLEHDRIAVELSFGTSTYQTEEGKLQTIQEMLLSAEDDLTRQLQSKSERSSKKAVNA
jgi:diguanylate cyclase (GGDEF)-like protein